MIIGTLLFALLPQDPGLASASPLLQTDHHLPHLGLSVREERWVDPATGGVLRRALDSQGRSVELDALLREERRLRVERNGKLSPELMRQLEAAGPEEAIDVVFWLREPEHPDFLGLIQERAAVGLTAEDARGTVLELARGIFAPGNLAFAERVRAAGGEVRLVGDLWPDVFASLRPEEVRALALRPEVDLVYYAFPEIMTELDNAQGTLRTEVVHDQGVIGAAGHAKVLVNDCGNVTTTHPELPPVIQMDGSGVSSHPCGVAGNIARNGTTLWAAARGLPQIYSADGCGGDVEAQTAWAWGLSQGIDIGNCSWWNGNKGSIVFLDRFFDYTIRNYSVMMFKSTGNQGTTGTPYVTSPGCGYNMTNTGCYNDGDNDDWSDDAMASYSSYWNPVEGHEKPEVASPGDGVITTGTSGNQSFGGTSSASPLTTGVATLLLNEDPSLLTSMTTLKSALMVSAWHNIEGSPVVSDKDGAGGVHATAAHAVVRDGQFETGTFTASSFPGGYYDKQIQLRAAEEVRVAALWFSNPDSAYTTDLLEMDLDLSILAPGGAVVASAADPFSAWELVQFTPATSGLYTVRLTRQRFDGTSEPYTIAWSTKLDSAVADVSFTGTPTLGATMQIHLRDRYDGNVPYVAAASFDTLPNFIPLQAGWILPLKLDRYVRYSTSGAIPSFMGNLNSSGEATAWLTIPNSPWLIGRTIYISFLTQDPTGDSRMVAPAASFVVQ